jgi:predicted porin
MKNKPLLQIVLYCLFLFCAVSKDAFAQTSKLDPVDSQAWYSAKLKIKLPQKWDIYTQYQARFTNDFKSYFGSYISLGVEKRVFKNISVFTDYRIAFVQKGIYNRLGFGTEIEKETHDFQFNFRLMLQRQYQNFDEIKLTQTNDYWRIRLVADYDITKRTSVFASIEPVMRFENNTLDNLRNIAGIKFKINKDIKGDVFYMYNPDYAKKYNRFFHELDFEITYTINAKRYLKNR